MTMTQDKLAAVRRAIPVLDKVAFLNTGSHGPLTAAAGELISRMALEEVNEGRLGSLAFQRAREHKQAVRADFARLFNCDLSEVALSTSTTAGMNIAAWGIQWREGDEIVTTDIEHGGGLAPLYILAHRFGVRLRFADTHQRGDDPVNAIRAVMTNRTRAIVLSHVSWSSGTVLPLADISELAHAQGAVVIVDAAQSAGAVSCDVKQLGIDAYAAPGQKWLCGPEGVGGLYINRERFDTFLPSWAGFGAFATHDMAGDFTLSDDGNRFSMVGGLYPPSLAGMDVTLRWLLDEVGLDWIYQRVPDNAARCRDLLERIEGVEVITPPGRHAGLVHFTMGDWDPNAAAEELLTRNVLVRSMGQPRCVRASTHFFNDENDLLALADAVKEVMTVAPHAPARGGGAG